MEAARPIVHVAVDDRRCRQAICDALQRQGWSVTEQSTGFHLLQAIADRIDGGAATAAAMPVLLVVDAIARGCSGITIAAGLRELGVRIPLVLVARHGHPVPGSDDSTVRIVGASDAAAAIAEIARSLLVRSSGTDGDSRVDGHGARGAPQGA